MALTFDNGKVNVKPFDIKYQDIKVSVGGTHGFDQTMNYNLKFDVPAKYLGTEANNLIAKMSPADAAKLDNIPINASLTGNFSNPKVSTDMKAAVSNLTTQLVNQQKEKLTQKGTSALTDLINKNTKAKDTTQAAKTEKEQKTQEVTKKASDLLNGLFKKKNP